MRTFWPGTNSDLGVFDGIDAPIVFLIPLLIIIHMFHIAEHESPAGLGFGYAMAGSLGHGFDIGKAGPLLYGKYSLINRS